MSNILFVSSSLMEQNSKSRQLAAEFIDGLRKADAHTTVVERHLTPANMPHLDMATLGALMTAEDQRSQVQQQATVLADAIVTEVEAADTIVVAAPMYNFSIPSTLKAWLDHLARRGRTFRYNEKGQPEGLLKNKKVYVVASRGGQYTGDSPAAPMNFQDPYLRTIFGFVGMTDVTFIPVEGQSAGADVAARGVVRARDALAGFITLATAA